MAIAKFTHTTVGEFAQSFRTKLKELETEFGIALTHGNLRFDEGSFNVTVKARLKGTAGEQTNPERKALELYYPKLVDKPIKLRTPAGEVRATVVGYRSRAKKFPFVVRLADGKLMVTSDQTVQRQAV